MVLCVLYWQSGPFAPSATAVAFVNGGKKGINGKNTKREMLSLHDVKSNWSKKHFRTQFHAFAISPRPPFCSPVS